jgi:hypothetical protein
MNPSERIKLIRDISSALGQENWSLIDLTLKQFGLPYADTWNGSGEENYVTDMISGAGNESLVELAKHLGVLNDLVSSDNPTFWANDDTRIFISHLVEIKDKTALLAAELEKYGFKTFVAHTDIEPTKEWQDEIELALSTADGLVALISPNFISSKWCDQEVGFSIGRRLPIVPVKIDHDPYGFIGKYQAVQGKGKSSPNLAKEIFELFISKPAIGQKLTNSLIRKLKDSVSWELSKRLVAMIEKSPHIEKSHLDMMKEALSENSQVADAWGVPERIKQIESRLSS